MCDLVTAYLATCFETSCLSPFNPYVCLCLPPHSDIPMPLVSSGVENGNLRELAMARMKDFGAECRDVRAREVGVHEIHNKVRPDEVELIRRDYTANGGRSQAGSPQ